MSHGVRGLRIQLGHCPVLFETQDPRVVGTDSLNVFSTLPIGRFIQPQRFRTRSVSAFPTRLHGVPSLLELQTQLLQLRSALKQSRKQRRLEDRVCWRVFLDRGFIQDVVGLRGTEESA